jgi:hypothetical protein
VTCDRKIACRIDIKQQGVKNFGISTGIYSTITTTQLRAKVKLILSEEHIKSKVTDASFAWEFAANTIIILAESAKQVSSENRKIWKTRATS